MILRARHASGVLGACKDVVMVCHLQKHDSVSGVTQSMSVQFSAGWRFVTVDSLLIDEKRPSISEMLETSAKDLLGLARYSCMDIAT